MENKEPSKQYDRPNVENKIKDFWEKEKIFEFSWDGRKPLFSVDTPPPYVSADHLHAGHIMSYAQAEFIVRYKRMRGFAVFYPMGFDAMGLPAENAAIKAGEHPKTYTAQAIKN
ncbi:class I tRNA ligase family protein, partial [Patescibacteria group bacterium]|nr:class I tRNA ligase family protein [Patescibacteria group bacterium]